jgi:hypothetical protein
MWSLITEHRLPAIVGGHFLALNDSNRVRNRVLSAAEVQHREAVAELMRCPAMCNGFSADFNRLPEMSATDSAVVR